MTEDATYNFTNKELKFSYWYVTNKLLLKKILIVSLILLGSLLWIYTIWQLMFFSINYNNEVYQIKRMVFGGNLGLTAIETVRPASLQISSPVSLSGEGDRNDYFVDILNSNNHWLATFDYEFISSGNSYVKKGFVLPGERKFLMGLSVGGRISDLSISNIKWERIVDPLRDYAEKYKFLIEDENFIAGKQPGDPNRMIFDITNNSPFNYWEVGAQVFLHSGGEIASIHYIVLDQFKSGEKRHVELNWNNRVPRVNNIEIIPELNIYDRDNIMSQTADPEIPRI